MKIGVVANHSKADAAAVLRQLLELGAYHGASILLEAAAARLIGKRGLPLRSLLRRVQLLLVLGGDGSLLRVVHAVHPSPVPLLGINLGRLGFLTAVRHDEIASVMPEVFHGRLRVSKRRPFEIAICTGKTKKRIPCALNDVVVARSSSRMALIRVVADGLFVNEYVADGLILATPTGSTAYSMAAGGPIISPETEGMILTPICPHSLSNRGLLLDGRAVVRIEVPSQGQPLAIQCDGVSGGFLRPGDCAEIRAAKAPVNLAFLKERDFFQILREKLKWSGAAIAPARI